MKKTRDANMKDGNSKKEKGGKKVNLFVKIIVWLIAVLAVACVAFYALWNYEISPVSKDSDVEAVEFKIPNGTSVMEAGRKLQEAGLIHNAKVFYYVARFNVFSKDSSFSLKSGTYYVKSSMDLKEIYFLLQEGSPEYITVHIPEGLTISKIGNILEEKNVCSAADFREACYNPDLALEYNIPAEHVEGYLFPDTYFLTPQMSAVRVARTMIDNFFVRISSVPNTESLSPDQFYKMLTLASIVEREYKVASEAPLIASVFKNRLRYNIGLYSCATIEYIITEIEGRPHPERITYDDLEIDSLYNTYKWAGLPPGPISNPGLTALNAAANAPKTDYYFFVLTDAEKGTHTFTSTFDEHKAAANTTYTKK